jgi:L-methionine (R)-S-oxide reductase
LAEDLKITKGTSRAETYEEIIPQIKALIAGELDIVANLANVAAVLKEAFDFFWIGFYFVKGNELVLGPFQGPVACTRIQKGKGVCGLAWLDKKVIVVPDVDQFPGHIACSSQSKSEIVLPVFKNGEVHLILDIDSDKADDFSEIDEKYLKEIIQIVEEVIV